MSNIYAGIDIGSTTSKCVLMDEDEHIISSYIMYTLHDRNESGEKVLEETLKGTGLKRDDITYSCATGYGRDAFLFARSAMPEIICHGRGTVKLLPGTHTIIDIGGQDSKIICLDNYGLVSKFEMNDKCAAGTGRFFEVLSNRLLNVSLDELGPLAMQSTDPCQLSSTCTVFAETEIVSYLSQGRSAADVSMGIMQSIVRRIYSMGAQTKMEFKEKIVVTGGLARNPALKHVLQEKLKQEIYTVDNPQLPAALGAALIARDNYKDTAAE